MTTQGQGTAQPPKGSISQYIGERRGAVELASRLQRPAPEGVSVERLAQAGDFPGADLYSPSWLISDETVMWFHGGGFVAGSVNSYARVAARIAFALGRRVALVDYRLAPEFPFPTAVEDAISAAEYFRAAGPMILGGDSAGANLALVAAQTNPSNVRALILLYPFLDLRLRWTDDQRSGSADDCNSLMAYRNAYLQGADPADERASPIFREIPAVPALFVGIAESDPLATDATRLVESAQHVGWVLSRTYPGTAHAFLLNDTPQSAVDAVLADIVSMLGDTDTKQ